MREQRCVATARSLQGRCRRQLLGNEVESVGVEKGTSTTRARKEKRENFYAIPFYDRGRLV